MYDIVQGILKKIKNMPINLVWKTPDGFSYLLPKSGSRSQKNGFFLCVAGVKSEFGGGEPAN